MKEVYELDVYKLAEELSDMIWYAFDKWSEKVKRTVGYQIIKASDSIAVHDRRWPLLRLLYLCDA